MDESNSDWERHNPDELSRIADELAAGKGRPETLDKLIRLLEAASDFLGQLTPEVSATTDDNALRGRGLLHTLRIIVGSALSNPDSLAKHYTNFASTLLDVLGGRAHLEPEPNDRRFKDRQWHEIGFYRGLMQIYLAWSKHMQAWADDQELSEEDSRCVDFILEQLTAALAPSNLPINPGGLKRARESDGKTATAGIINWIQDVRYNQSMPRQINENAYTVGLDLAITPGQVIYRNDQLELIHYLPQTERVYRKPLLVIPPQINKYYIFDLKPRNSFIGHLVRQGFQMFVISWKNPGPEARGWGLEIYLEACLDAITVIRRITRSQKINLISACAGGLTAMSLLGYLAENKINLINSHSLMVTALLPNSGSILELLTTPESLEISRKVSAREGTMDGRDLARIFAWLRPNEFVWSYWVNNYIMGRQPPPLDVLYWDNDSTRLPAQLHSDFIDMFASDVFQNAGRHRLFDCSIDYRKVQVDTYFLAGLEDYLMPWKGIYREALLFRGNHRFALSVSGHVQSILRPPHLARTKYYTNDKFPENPDEWLAGATLNEGSWWSDWNQWLIANSGSPKKAPSHAGNTDYPPLNCAPGNYVHERISHPI